jgi:FkbM family methyltransferase
MWSSMSLPQSDSLKFWWKRLKYRWRETRWASLGADATFLFTLQPNLRMKLYADSELCRLIYYRNFESVEREFLNRFLRPGDVFVDVGANIGIFTLIAAIRVGPTGQVIAFEPSTPTYWRLVGNVRLNNFRHVCCEKLALSDKEGKSILVQSVDGFDAWNSLAKPTMGESFTNEQVYLVSWTKYAREHGLVGSTRMMKIDVEGWESRVLAGGKEIFSRTDAPVLQIEFSGNAAKAAGSSCQGLYRTLESLNYRMFAYSPERKALRPASINEVDSNVNLMAAKDPDFVNERLNSNI